MPIICFGQESNLIEQKHKIDSYVKLIDNTENDYLEGIAEGPILDEDGSESESVGGWTAYYLYKNPDINPPLRIRFKIALPDTYEEYDLYYKNENLIFARVNVNFYEGKKKDEIFEKILYFSNGKLIWESKSDLIDYNSDSILQTDQFVRNMIYD